MVNDNDLNLSIFFASIIVCKSGTTSDLEIIMIIYVKYAVD